MTATNLKVEGALEDQCHVYIAGMMAQFSAHTRWPIMHNTLIKNTDIPIPPLFNRTRVGGFAATNDPDGCFFQDSGYANLGAYKRIYEVYSKQRFEDAQFLDWGCGCGRLFRHLPPEMHANAHGADVDPVNLEWNRQNIPFGTFTRLYPSRPFPYEDDQFDVVCGTSVFTHLDEEEQFFWLKELSRISRGYVLVSIHGMCRASQAPWSNDPRIVAGWLQDGFINAKDPLPDIADVVDPDYYRRIAHTWAYIREQWPKYIDVIDIVPGCICSQDAVVCRPRR